MQPDLRDAGYLADMLRFSREAVAMAADTVTQANVRRRALEQTILLIGEAASHISTEFQAAHPEIRWSDLIGQRDWLLDGYRDVEWSQLLDIVESPVPQLIQQLVELVPES
jgi:uncharacterized protein with HEPN domain